MSQARTRPIGVIVIAVWGFLSAGWVALSYIHYGGYDPTMTPNYVWPPLSSPPLIYEASACLTLLAGIGLITLKSWGRILEIIVAVGSTVRQFIPFGYILQFVPGLTFSYLHISGEPHHIRNFEDFGGVPVGGYYGGIMGFTFSFWVVRAVQFVFYLWALWYLFTPRVKQEFRKTKVAP